MADSFKLPLVDLVGPMDTQSLGPIVTARPGGSTLPWVSPEMAPAVPRVHRSPERR